MKYKTLVSAVVLLGVLSYGVLADNEDSGDDLSGPSGVIIAKYLQASQLHADSPRGTTMQVDIDASLFKLKEQGRLKALRKISKFGHITYRVLGFQGDNTVKNQVIARYLDAEQQNHDTRNLSVTPANYKFKFKGQKVAQDGTGIYIFQVSPRAKRVGLFKGELWLSASNCLPVLEKGRLVKNPSIFFKKVDFEQAFALHNGAAVPEHMSSTIETRLFGKVALNVSYSNFTEDSSDDEDGASPSTRTSFVSASYR